MTQTTDTQLLAQWTRYALDDGRYALAVELAKLTQRAAAYGFGNDAEAFAAAAAVLDAVPVPLRRVPMLDDTQRLQRPGDTLVLHDDLPTDAVSHAPNRCAQLVEQNGSRRACNELIRFELSDLDSRGWKHIDPDAGADHDPVPYGAVNVERARPVTPAVTHGSAPEGSH